VNYPIWDIANIGGYNLIALISILHVFVAHFAVGGGLFIWLLDLKAQREKSSELNSYLRHHTKFFLLLTMVFGGLSGVGIWFIIGLVHPQATSTLIHNFVYGWAIEWVFFIGEIISLLVYYYKFELLSPKERKLTSFLYFLFAILSLIVVNGILSFMLTPGKWLETRNFWDGILNPSFLPSTLFRSFFAFIVAGVFGYFTTITLKDSIIRRKILIFSSKFILFSIPFLVLSGLWYYDILSDQAKYTTFVLNQQSHIFVKTIFVTTAIITILSILMVLRFNGLIKAVIAIILVPISLLWISGFEFLRETARKPYIIYGYMYSNSILKNQEGEIQGKGILKVSKWVDGKNVQRSLWNSQCSDCHTIKGINRPIAGLLEGTPKLGIEAYLTGQGEIYKYMPRFLGTKTELIQLRDFIDNQIHPQEVEKETEASLDSAPAIQVPSTSTSAQYVLFSWATLGMHCMTDADKFFSILPPANTIHAILIKRGDPPEIVTDGVEVSYEIEAGFEDPSNRLEFWNYVKSLYGLDLKRNFGLAGDTLKGVMKQKDEIFVVDHIPVSPYSSDDKYLPYPLVSIKAIKKQTHELLAQTKVVAPVSTEVGCKNCHGGGWNFKNKVGLSDATATKILKLHDKRHKTNLLKGASKGNPIACASCHGDLATEMKGIEGVLPLSVSIHGFHASYVPFKDSKACMLCHPSSPTGATRCLRDLHVQRDLTCTDCHGSMQKHALSLLKSEANKPKSQVLIEAILKGNQMNVKARKAWIEEPHCLQCHKNFGSPEVSDEIEAHMLYREQRDDVGIPCMACHGPTHALYPATNPYDSKRDNFQPIQYTGRPIIIGSQGSCYVCHTKEPDGPGHHPNMRKKTESGQ